MRSDARREPSSVWRGVYGLQRPASLPTGESEWKSTVVNDTGPACGREEDETPGNVPSKPLVKDEPLLYLHDEKSEVRAALEENLGSVPGNPWVASPAIP